MAQWPDIWVTGTDNQSKDIINRMGEAGKLIDWMPLLESMPEVYSLVKGLIPTALHKGKLYGLPLQYTNIDVNPCYATDIGVSIRRDWLAQLGLPYPKTMDQLFDTLLAFRDGITLPGGAGVVPIALFSDSFQELLSYFYPNYKDNWYWDPEKAQAVFPNMETPEYLANGLKWHNKLYREGLIARDAFTMKQSQVDEQINQGLVGAVKGASWAVGTYNNVLGEDKALVLTGILYDHNTNPEPPKQLVAAVPYVLVTAKTDAPMDLIYGYLKYVAYIGTEAGTLLAYYGIEGTHWEYDANGKVRDTPDCAQRLKGDWSLRAEEGIGLYGAEWNYDVLKRVNPDLDLATTTAADWVKESYRNQGFMTYQGYTANPNFDITPGEQEMKWNVGNNDRFRQMVI
jgi:putative aldouronate transport system substrate-binding protein